MAWTNRHDINLSWTSIDVACSVGMVYCYGFIL